MDDITDSMDMSLSQPRELVMDRERVKKALCNKRKGEMKTENEKEKPR